MDTTHTGRQIKIIHTAIRIIGEKELSGLTTRNLSKTLGVTDPIIYRHFKDKTAIISAILDFLKEGNRKTIETVMAERTDTLDRLEHFYLLSFTSFKKAPGLTATLFCDELCRKTPGIAEKILEIMESTHFWLTALLKEAERRREITLSVAPEQMAEMIMGTMRFAINKWRLAKYKTDLVAHGQELVQSFRNLLERRKS